MYKGEIKDFPTEIVEKMIERQIEQGNAKSVSVFEKDRSVSIFQGGFFWHKTPEGDDWWCKVIEDKNFELFFELYPKKATFKKGDRVMVKDRIHEKWEDAIFLTEIAGAEYPYYCVDKPYESEFKKGEVFFVQEWEEIKEMPEVVCMTMQEICDMLGMNIKLKQ